MVHISFILSFIIFFDFVKETHNIQVSTNCSTLGSNYYYDTTVYTCQQCISNAVSSDYGGCVCKTGFKANYDSNNNLISCTSCGQGVSSSPNGLVCQSCPSASTFNSLTNTCQCPTGSIINQYSSFGVYSSVQSCVQCPSGTYLNNTLCKACPQGSSYSLNFIGSCTCEISQYTQAGAYCVPNNYTTKAPTSGEFSITYNDGIDQSGNSNLFTIAQSDTFSYLYLFSAYKCDVMSNSTYCQILANLCVLKLYNTNSPDCDFYIKLLNSVKFTSLGNGYDLNWKIGLPFLYYSSSTNILNDTTRVKFSVSFDPNIKISTGYVSELQLYIAKYDIYGNYYGMEPLTTQLMLCNANFTNGNLFRSFGSNIQNNCNFDFSVYISRSYQMMFYQVFMLDPVSNKMLDIPVIIQNSNLQPSTCDPTSNKDISNCKLTSRFFLVDNLSGITGNGAFIGNETTTSFIRYAKFIQFTVNLQLNVDSKMYNPFFIISYETQSLKDLNNKLGSTIARTTFQSMYAMDTSNFLNSMSIIWALLMVTMGVVLACQMYIWTKNNPSDLSPDNYLLWFIWNFIVKLFYTWSHFMFWFLFAITAYWYVFFKLQYTVFILLPALNTWYVNYRSFDIIYGISASAFTFYMIYKVWDQTNYDIFFIDWEHDKEILVKSATDLRTERYRGAWRGLFIVNEFNELQNSRRISVPFCFGINLVFWYFIGWQSNITYIPNLQTIFNSPKNRILGYFLTSFVLIICGIASILIRKILERLILPSKKTDFIDLLTVSNISVFILDQSLHGYYIHGQCPSGKADTNMHELLLALEEEGQGRLRNRGFEEKDEENLQTYEMYISYNTRIMYDGFFGNQAESMILTAQTRDKMFNQSRIANPLRALPKTLPIDKIYRLKSYINNELKEKIQKIRNSPSQYIKQKTKLQRFLDYPPIEYTGNSVFDIVFFKDPNMSFDTILFSGIEWDWFIWNILVFQFWQIVIGLITLSTLLTLITDLFLWWIRSLLAEKNLARKSIIDDKFLL